MLKPLCCFECLLWLFQDRCATECVLHPGHNHEDRNQQSLAFFFKGNQKEHQVFCLPIHAPCAPALSLSGTQVQGLWRHPWGTGSPTALERGPVLRKFVMSMSMMFFWVQCVIYPVTMYLFVQQVFYYEYKYYVHRLYGKYDMYTLTSLKLTSMNQVPSIGVITL